MQVMMWLRKNDYDAFVRSITEEGKTLHKVRVGPELLRSDAKRLQQKLQQNMSLNGIIITYP